MNSKDEKSYRLKNFVYFSFGIIFIIISEISLRYTGLNVNNMIAYFILPITIFFGIYSYIYFNHQSYGGK